MVYGWKLVRTYSGLELCIVICLEACLVIHVKHIS